MSRIDLETRTVVAKVPAGDSPVNLDVIDGEVWVPDDLNHRLVRIDPSSNTVAEQIDTGGNPAVVAGGEGDVWATIFDVGAVWRLHRS